MNSLTPVIKGVGIRWVLTFSPLDRPEVIEAIDALKKASLTMVHDILRSDAKQPKLLMNEVFGI